MILTENGEPTQEALEAVSDILNDYGVYEALTRVLGADFDSDHEAPYEIEEFIVMRCEETKEK